MRGYIIMHDGATIKRNIVFDNRMDFPDKSCAYVTHMFYKRKDAEKYLNTFLYNDCFQIVGVTIDKSNKDNRKTKDYGK